MSESQSNKKSGSSMMANMNKSTKTLIGVGVAVLVLVAGFFGYKELVEKPNEEKASAALFRVERWYAADSLNYVLEGDGQYEGALQIVKKHGGTPAGNQAKFYLGMAYLNMGQYDDAIKYLQDFNGHGTLFAYTAYGSIGDAYMEKKEIENGIKYYKKATELDHSSITPMYLFRAAKALEMNNQTDEAIVMYKKIKDNYPFSRQAREVEKALGLLGDTEI